MGKDRFEVTVTSVNEGVRDPPYLTVTGYGLIIAPDGSLSIMGVGGSQSMAAATWDRFEVKNIARPQAQAVKTLPTVTPP
jgi:hypothetical protein